MIEGQISYFCVCHVVSLMQQCMLPVCSKIRHCSPHTNQIENVFLLTSSLSQSCSANINNRKWDRVLLLTNFSSQLHQAPFESTYTVMQVFLVSMHHSDIMSVHLFIDVRSISVDTNLTRMTARIPTFLSPDVLPHRLSQNESKKKRKIHEIKTQIQLIKENKIIWQKKK